MNLRNLGLAIERFGPGAIVVREAALLGQSDVAGLLKDLADDLEEYGAGLALKERLEDILLHHGVPWQCQSRQAPDI